MEVKNYQDVIQLLIKTTDDLANDKISVEKARQVATNTQVLINAAKLHFDVCKHAKTVDLNFFSTSPSKQLESPKKVPVHKDDIENFNEKNKDKKEKEDVKRVCRTCDNELECRLNRICKPNSFEKWQPFIEQE